MHRCGRDTLDECMNNQMNASVHESDECMSHVTHVNASVRIHVSLLARVRT